MGSKMGPANRHTGDEAGLNGKDGHAFKEGVSEGTQGKVLEGEG